MKIIEKHPKSIIIGLSEEQFNAIEAVARSKGITVGTLLKSSIRSIWADMDNPPSDKEAEKKAETMVTIYSPEALLAQAQRAEELESELKMVKKISDQIIRQAVRSGEYIPTQPKQIKRVV